MVSGSKILAFSAIAFSVALAVVVGNRMSAEAMAVVIGVVCGVAASIPMSAIILALSRRSRAVAREESAPPARPPVILVAPTPMPRPAAGWADYSQAYPPPAVPAPREFRVIGDDSFWSDHEE